MLHQYISISSTNRLLVLLIIITFASQQLILAETVQNFQNNVWKIDKNLLSQNQENSIPLTTISNQFLLDKNINEDSNESRSLEDSDENDDDLNNNNKLNINKDKLINNENILNNLKLDHNNSIYNKSEFSLINRNQFNNKLLKDKKQNRTSFYFNNRLKARHVASGDQLRIIRKEGQSLRLSCLPAFHAPARSSVNWFKNGDLIKIPEQSIIYKWSLQLKFLKQEDSGVYECVVQNLQIGRTSVLYVVKVLPSLSQTAENNNQPNNLNQDKSDNNTTISNRSRKSVLDSQNNLINWSTNSDKFMNNRKENRLNDDKFDNTVLSLHNITIERIGQKATLRCVADGLLANSHFRWFFKTPKTSTQLINSKEKRNEIKLPIDNHSTELFNQLYQKNIILNSNSNIYQSLTNDDQLNNKHYNLHHSQTINQSTINQFDFPIDNIYIESYKVFLPNGAFSYASELTVQVDQSNLGEYLCLNFGQLSIHYKSAFIKLKETDNTKSKYFYLQSTTNLNENITSLNNLNDNRFLNSYGWFNEDHHLSNVAMIRHSPSSANKLNYIQHDKLNVPISSAITVEQKLKQKQNQDNENLFLIIVPVTIGIILIVIILFSLINYLKKIPNIPDLTDQCLIVQQIKPVNLIEHQTDKNDSNLIINPLSDENLDINTILNSTIKLSNLNTNQVTNTNQTVAQLNEIYHPVVNGPHTHSHLLIKPSNSFYSSIVQTVDKNYLKKDDKDNQLIHDHYHSVNLNNYYFNNQAQLDFEHDAFSVAPIANTTSVPTSQSINQQWPVNCCESCQCSPMYNDNLHRAPD